jgi:undecaprenyl-diphosphatase
MAGPLATLAFVYVANPESQTTFFAWLDRQEARFVQRCVDHARRRRLTGAARAITRAGNGWLYPIVSVLLLAASFPHAARCLLAAMVSMAVAFTIYPPLKRHLARSRPCHSDHRLGDALRPLDRHSFPSGHAMTAAAFGVPIVLASPLSVIPIVVAGCALMSWSRLALGHHYLSDVLAGTALGAAIAAAVAVFVL